MVACGGCGAGLAAGDRFCVECGAPAVVCAACGEPAAPSNRFCRACEQALAGTAPRTAAAARALPATAAGPVAERRSRPRSPGCASSTPLRTTSPMACSTTPSTCSTPTMTRPRGRRPAKPAVSPGGWAASRCWTARTPSSPPGPEAEPVLRRASPAEMRERLGGAPPEQGAGLDAVLDRVLADVLPYPAGTNHPGYFAFIPYFTTWPAALAELIAAAANMSPWAWMEAPATTQIELEVIDWFRGWLGMPQGTAGVLVSGGSAANLTALLVAREAAGGPSEDAVVYVSDQGHSSLARTARAMGLRSHQVRVLPTDDHWQLQPETVTAAAGADRRAGRVPIAVCASAGSTSTGAIDPLPALADVCAAEGLWLHVDAAYGGFAAVTPKGRALLAGIERADSVTVDPHKWLFQPFECGGVLVREGERLARTFAIHPDYLDSTETHATGEVNLGEWGLQQ